MRLRVVLESGKAGPWLKESDWRAAWKEVYGEVDTAFALLAGWMHLFLWGMSMADRARMLSAVLGRPVARGEIDPGESGLKGWEDFPDAYETAPIRVEEGE
jgi:hypothetical protein